MKKLSSITVIILLLIVVVNVVITLVHNHNMSHVTKVFSSQPVKKFVRNPKAYDYESAITTSNINVDEVLALFPSAVALPKSSYDFTNEIVAPVTIHYYNAIGDLTPVFVINKGERIHVKNGSSLSLPVYGYGFDSLPTNVAGWRIAYPFISDSPNEQLFYVRLNELASVARSWIKVNNILYKNYVQQGEEIIWLTEKKKIQIITMQADRVLYETGVYLSPDLYRPVIPISSVIMLALVFIIIGVRIYLHVAKRKAITSNESV